MKRLLKLLREALPDAIGGLIAAAILALVGALWALAGVWLAAAVGVAGLWVGCLYVFVRKKGTGTDQGAYRKHLTRLRRILAHRFNKGELRTLCFDLGIDYDDLPGKGKSNKGRELVSHLERRNRIPDLLKAGKRLRSDISWGDVPNKYKPQKRADPFYSKWERRFALVGLIIIPLLAVGMVGYKLYQPDQTPDKVIILVADFEGPEPQYYRVTETVLAQLRVTLEPYADVEVQALGEVISEAEGTAVAREEGEKRKADIVIWGWYGLTADVVPLSVHFELLRAPRHLPELGPELKGQVRTMAVVDLESFALQTNLSEEMAYLCLVTMGMTRIAANDWEGAIARFSDALNQTKERVSALDQSAVYIFRGYAYLSKGDNDQAIADNDRAIELNPRLTSAYVNQCTARYRQGDLTGAIADCDRAIELDPDNAIAFSNRGRIHYEQGDWEEAIDDYDRLIELDPDNADAYVAQCATRHNQGDLEAAIADCDRAIELDPDNAIAYQNRGNIHYEQGDLEGAIDDYDRLIELDPDNADAYSSRGLARHDQGDLTGAIADYNRVIELDPDNVKAYGNRGNVRYNQSDLEGAIADYNRVIELDPDDTKAYQNRSNVRYEQGDLEGAIDDYDRLIELDPDNVYAYYNRGNVRYDQGDLERAIADYNRVIELDPNSAGAYNNRGHARYDQGDLVKAIADYNRAIELDPDNAIAFSNRGLARYGQDNLEGAIADLDQAIELDPGFAEAYTNRGNVRKVQGDLEGAIADFRRYLELRPNADNRRAVEEAIAELEAQISEP